MNIRKLYPVAEQFAALSKDPRTQVGCLIVDERGSVRASGWNGFPRGVKDIAARYENRHIKLIYVAHAEANAIANAASMGTPLAGCSLIVTKFPCNECAKLIIGAGIKHIISAPIDYRGSWAESNQAAISMFNEAGITYEVMK